MNIMNIMNIMNMIIQIIIVDDVADAGVGADTDMKGKERKYILMMLYQNRLE